MGAFSGLHTGLVTVAALSFVCFLKFWKLLGFRW